MIAIFAPLTWFLLNLPAFLSRLGELFKFDFKFYLGSPGRHIKPKSRKFS
jgi:hypothetical protein